MSSTMGRQRGESFGGELGSDAEWCAGGGSAEESLERQAES